MIPFPCILRILSLCAAAATLCLAQKGPPKPAGDIEIPEGWIPSPLVLELTEQIRGAQGDEPAIQFLSAQFANNAEKPNEFEALFSAVWEEAQFGTGFKNLTWGSRLNDVAFISAYRNGYYQRALDIMQNLSTRLWQTGRCGRLAEVYAVFEDAYRKGGLKMDPTAYPDRGPAFPSLPMIRQRDIPVTVPFAKIRPPGVVRFAREMRFDKVQTMIFLGYADHLWFCGDWKRSLEWKAWIRKWASDERGGPTEARNESWYSATLNIASMLENYGYFEDSLALVDAALAAPHGESYRKRHKIRAAHMQLDLRRKSGRADPDLIPKLSQLITTMENNIHMGKNSADSVRLSLVDALFDAGQVKQARSILDQLIAEGHVGARWNNVSRQIEAGETDGVEEELISLLSIMRKNGHKYNEIGLYAMYADFLESAGRFPEALAMRRETVRIAGEFGGFTTLPVQLAKLSALLRSLGEAELADKAAEEARTLLKAHVMPPSTVERVNKLLAPMERERIAIPKQQPVIDLQPHRGLVIPIEGAPWSGYLTLTNPGSDSVPGSIEISGAPMNAKVDTGSGDILVNLENAKGDGRSVLPLTLAPGSYRLVTITADAQHAGDGELLFSWRSSGGAKVAEANLLIDKREQVVAGAVIQAGDYQTNPFYGVPIHLTYVASDRRAKSSPLRLKASQPARIEIHSLDGTPLAVDGSGNGSLRDVGDELFSETDGFGNLRLDLIDGAAAIRIVAYPEGRIAKDGLKIDIEVFDGGEWRLHSSNRIEP